MMQLRKQNLSKSTRRSANEDKPNIDCKLLIWLAVLRQSHRYVIVPLLMPDATSRLLFGVACFVTGITLFTMGAIKVRRVEVVGTQQANLGVLRQRYFFPWSVNICKGMLLTATSSHGAY